jgi:hypothetical protein
LGAYINNIWGWEDGEIASKKLNFQENNKWGAAEIFI